MKVRADSTIVMGVAVAVALALVGGCAKQSSKGTAEVKERSARATAPSAASALGGQQNAGPFRVTLTSTPASPKVGKAHFMAAVTKDGQPVKDATVRLTPSMSSMGGSTVTMKPMGNGYGADVDLSMPGQWTAKVDVAQGGQKGTAEYIFTANK